MDQSKYCVLLYTCPGLMPFSFAVHPWFVCIKNGVVSRYEVVHKKNTELINWGYFHKDILPAEKGIKVLPFFKKYNWSCSVVMSINGEEGSLAQRVLNFIETSNEMYPYKEKYFITGPNSNTYIQWVLNNFPEINYKLPWNAVGKNYLKNY